METQLNPDQKHEIQIIDGIPTLISTDRVKRKTYYWINESSTILSGPFEVGHMPHSQNRNLCTSYERAEQILAYTELLKHCDEANGYWVPNWEDSDITKYVIDIYNNRILIAPVLVSSTGLAFRTREIAEQFVKQHKALIEVAKYIL